MKEQEKVDPKLKSSKDLTILMRYSYSIPLLTKDEEYNLGVDMQRYMKVVEDKKRYCLIKGKECTDIEYCEQTEQDYKEIIKIIRRGLIAKDKLIRHNLRYVAYIAKRIVPYGKTKMLTDAIQEGMFGLVRAVEKYDPTKGNRFTTYAAWWIRRSITTYLINDKMIVTPSNISTLVYKLKKLTREYYQKNNTVIPIDLICKELEITREKYKQIVHLLKPILSIDSINYIDSSIDSIVNNNISSAYTSNNPMDLCEDQDLIDSVRLAIEQLDYEEKQVITKYYGINQPKHTLDEISRDLNINKERVSTVKHNALTKLSWNKYSKYFIDYV